jgi:integrase
LRAKDIDFTRAELLVRDGKGQKDRVTMLPVKVQSALREHLDIVRRQHSWDLSQGLGRVPLPAALARKYPNADREWGWQWVFPAPTHYFDRQANTRFRFHLNERTIQKAVREAAIKADIQNTSHRMFSGTVLRRMSCRLVTTSAPFRNCSVTKMSRRP